MFVCLSLSACAQKVDVLNLFKFREIPSSMFQDYVIKNYSYPTDVYVIPGESLNNKSVKEATLVLQTVLDQHSKVLLPNMTIVISDKGIALNSNQELYFQPNSKIVLAPSKIGKYQLISIKDVKNVKVINPNLEGDRENHIGNIGEQGHGISINGSSNVVIQGFMIKNFWGDGIYIGTADNIRGSSSIQIKNGIVDNNRRNGISITNVTGLLLERVISANANGTMPMFGLDIEPNWANNHQIKNVSINNLLTYNNANGGMMIAIHKLAGKEKKDISIDIKNYRDILSFHGLFFGGIPANFDKARGYLNLTSIKLERNTVPIKLRSNSQSPSFKFGVYDFKVIQPADKKYNTNQLNKMLRVKKINVDKAEAIL